MDGSAAFRRAFHIASPVFLGYFLLPEELPGGISRIAVTILFVGTALCIEIARIALGIRMFGMRPYEGQRVSAYAQGLLGLAFGLLVIADPRVVVPVFLGMAWIDPLSAMARRRGWPRVGPTIAYALLFLGTILVMDAFPLPAAILLTAVATSLAMVAEGPKIPQIDDDLLMQVLPYVVLYALVIWLGVPSG